MDKGPSPARSTTAQVPQASGLPLDEERLKIVLHQWDVIHRSIRAMDALELGETEPATVYLWEDRR